jgi:beta-phosphoglucomutase-like phosphatase (HAD superfamily)
MKALVFDMDGLLVDTEDLHLRTFATLATARGVPCSPRDLYGWIGKGQHRLASWIVSEAGEGSVEEIVAAQRAAFLEALEAERPAPQPGFAELLEVALGEGLALGLVSNSDEVLVRATMDVVLPHLKRSTRLEETFSVVVTRDRVSHPKPAPDPYLLAAEELGLAPAECLVFEDSPSGGVAARAAGCRLVAVPCPYLSDASALVEVADHVYPSLRAAYLDRVWEL